MSDIEALVWRIRNASNRNRPALQRELARTIAAAPITIDMRVALTELIPQPTPLWRCATPKWAMEPRR